MTDGVKVVVRPTGERLVSDEDDARVQAEAMRLGVLEQIAAAVRTGSGQRGAAIITRDGNRLVAIIAWAGFAKASNNGWGSLSISPVSEKAAGWLMDAVNALIDADHMALLPTDTSWRN